MTPVEETRTAVEETRTGRGPNEPWHLRTEEPRDRAAVWDVVARAFGRSDEADLVDILRTDPSWIPELSVVADARGVRPILLLDDVSSELDRARTASLFAFLRDHRGQVFLTTTRRELIDTGELSDPRERVDFSVVSGRIEPA